MATITGSTNSSLWTFKMETTEGNYDIANNTSPLTVDVYIGRSSSAGSYIEGANISCTVGCTGCASQTFTYRNTGRVNISAGGWLKIGSVTFSAVPHNIDGSKTVYVSASFSQTNGVKPSSGSAADNVVLTTIPRQATLTSAPDFTDEENPTIYYSNPAGNAVTIQACISFTGTLGASIVYDDVIYRELDPYSTSYTFNLDEVIPRDSKTGHDILRAGTTSGKQYRFVTFFVTTTIGNETYYSTLQRTYTVVNCAPELNPTVEDMGTASYRLTNDRSTLIRYFNLPMVTFNAYAKKGASIVTKTVTCGSQTQTEYGDHAYFENVDSNIFVVSVTDNRGITVSKEITMDMIPYVNLTCNAIINTDLGTDNTDSTMNLTVRGDCYLGLFGPPPMAAGNNLIVEYRYKSGTTDYPIDENGNEIWTPMSSMSFQPGDKYECTELIENLDYTKTYTVQVRAKDYIYTSGVRAKDEIVKIIPVFDWSENDFNFNIPVTAKDITANIIDAASVTTDSITTRDIETDQLHIAGKLMVDYMIERGTEDTWYYEKWASGKAVCYGKKNFGTLTTSAWGNFYATSELSVDFPSGLFIENPQYIGMEFLYGGYGGWIEKGSAAPTKDGYSRFSIVRANSRTFSNATIGFYVVGYWK